VRRAEKQQQAKDAAAGAPGSTKPLGWITERLPEGAKFELAHFVGPRMDVGGRIIQRCNVCGAKLCDHEGVMILNNLDGPSG
jgi:hypothetical protein